MTHPANDDKPNEGYDVSEYHEMQKEAAEARVGADRMAMGLSCIPNPARGDMAEVERLTALWEARGVEIERLQEHVTDWQDRAMSEEALTERLRADNARLREALEEISQLEDVNSDEGPEIARRALEPK